MLSRIRWSGTIEVTVRHRDGRIRRRDRFTNLITDAALDELLAPIGGGGTADMQITWVALGDDATVPAPSDTTLGNEVFRKQVTSTAKTGNARRRTTLFVAPGDHVGQVEEIGWFAGNASGTVDTGLLVARVLWSHELTALESVTIERVDELRAV